jgi:hypothetical protein
MYQDLKYLNEECSTEQDATERESIRGCPRLEILYDVKWITTSVDVMIVTGRSV